MTSSSRTVAVQRVSARALGSVVGLAVLLAAMVLSAAPALAHNTLLGTDPADGSTVEVAPSRVTLTFDEPAQALGTEMVVLGPDGSTVSTGDAELVDATVSQALVTDLPAGMYTVQWRVTSADGHPLSGALTFTAANGSGTPADASTAPETTTDPAPDATGAPTTGPTATATAGAASPADDPTGTEVAEDEEAGLAAGAVVAIIAGVLAVAALVGFVVHERRKSKRA